MTKSIRVSINPSKTREALAKGQFCGFMTVYEIADLLRVEPLTIYRYIRSKKLIAYKLGKEYRVKQEDFEKFLATCKTVK